MIRYLCFLLLTTTPLYAAQIGIKSGEHEGFSQLVLQLPRGADWDLTGQERDYRLTVTPHTDGFGVGDVFRLIPRTRLDRIESTSDQLALKLACKCPVTVDTINNRYLVVDIADAPVKNVQNAGVLPVTLPRRDPVLPNIALTDGASETARIDAFRETVLHQFSRAASQDLLDLTYPPVAPQITAPQDHTPNVPKAQVATTTQIPRPAQPRLAITNALDDALQAGRIIRKSEALGCYDPRDFNVETWASPDGLSANLAERRTSLMGEFDRLNTDAAWGLLRVYLRYGLAEEATQILDSFPLTGLRADAARAAIAVFNDAQFTPDHPFLAMSACDPSVAIWAVSSGQSGKLSPDIAQAILPIFSAMPLETRRLLAPKLIGALEASGLRSEAGIARASLERSVAEGDGTYLATLLSADDGAALTNTQLFEIVSRNDDQSPRALELHLSRSLDAGSIPDDGMLTLVQSYIAQLKGAAVAAELQALNARILSRQGRYTDAFDAITTLPAASQPDLLTYHLEDVSKIGADQDVALLATRLLSNGGIAMLEDVQRQALAVRLGEIGLPDVALQILGETPDTQTVRENLAQGFRGSESRGPQTAPLAEFLDAPPVQILPTLASANTIVAQSEQLGTAIEALLGAPQ